jgi:hypothetical protein
VSGWVQDIDVAGAGFETKHVLDDGTWLERASSGGSKMERDRQRMQEYDTRK